MTERFIFTVSTGRCGQASLAKLVDAYVDDCYAGFEEPNITLHFKGFLGDLERHFRRRFIETHELLGRGKVLPAFENGDEKYLDTIVAKRLRLIERKNSKIYFDIGKMFARGLHHAFARACPGFALVLLVRDPVVNMRSYLNRHKNFAFDNSMPGARRNLLRLSYEDFEEGEFYLWIWCELYLRYLDMIERYAVEHHTIIRTDDLNDADKMNAHLDALNLAHRPVRPFKPVNTNVELGKGETVVTAQDVDLFKRFLARVPGDIREKIDYLSTYEPDSLLA